MPAEPVMKRTIAFFDGQNLFHAIKETFGYTYPSPDKLEPKRAKIESKLPRSKLRGISPTAEIDFRLVPLLDIEYISLSHLLSLLLLHFV